MALIKGKEIANRIYNRQKLVADGAMGTVLIQEGVRQEEILKSNRDCPDRIRRIHESYLNAGADIISSNTFGVWDKPDSAHLVRQGLQIATDCARNSPYNTGVVFSVIPGMAIDGIDLIKELSNDPNLWPDAVLVETCTSLNQALRAVETLQRIQLGLLVVTCHFNRKGIMLDGTSPKTAAEFLIQAGVDIVGANCGDDPDSLVEAVGEMADATQSPLYVQPSAGIPNIAVSSLDEYPVDPQQFGVIASRLYSMGVSVVGGCCGTTVRHIRAVRAACSKAI